MPLITLTTDYGMKDFYVGVLKAHLIKSFPDTSIADISHLITPYNIVEGSMVFKSSWQYFPDQTIHLIDIDPLGGQSNILFCTFRNQHFIMPDNGILSMIFDQEENPVVYKLDITSENKTAFQLFDLFIAAIRLIKQDYQNLTPFTQFAQSLSFQPVYTIDTIHANVVYIDHYRNAILNVHKSLFDRIRKDRKFEIVWKKFNLSALHHNIHEVAENEIACYFNSAGYLTIGLNKAKAAELLGLQLHSEVLIDFIN